MTKAERMAAISQILFGAKLEPALQNAAAVLIGEELPAQCLATLSDLCMSGDSWDKIAKMVIATAAAHRDYAVQWIETLGVPLARIPDDEVRNARHCSDDYVLGCVLGGLHAGLLLDEGPQYSPSEEFDCVLFGLLQTAILKLFPMHHSSPSDAYCGQLANAAKAFVRGHRLPMRHPHKLLRLRRVRELQAAVSRQFVAWLEAGKRPLYGSLISMCLLEELQFAYFGALTLGYRSELIAGATLEEKHITDLIARD